MDPFNWRCPFCEHNAAISLERFHSSESQLEIPNAHGPRHLGIQWVVCPNQQCRRFTLEVIMSEVVETGFGTLPGKELRRWSLIPPAHVGVLPDYIPRAIVQDYEEACQIAELSPKAAATLARRCLQGMIRDFWQIRKDRLKQEIEALEEKVQPLTWQAIDAVRKVGNIGAHMEKDVDVIVDVEPEEARQLIGLIELLVEDWYIGRHDREGRLRRIREIGESKEAERRASQDEGSAEK